MGLDMILLLVNLVLGIADSSKANIAATMTPAPAIERMAPTLPDLPLAD